MLISYQDLSTTLEMTIEDYMMIGYRDFSTALDMTIKIDKQYLLNRPLMRYESR